MDKMSDPLIFFIVLTVLLFMFLGIAILVLIDHKARLPGGFTSNPFSIRGMRRDHPYIAFLTTTILVSIISVLFFELFVTITSSFDLFSEEEAPQILQELKEQRFTEKQRHFHNVPSVDKVTLGKSNVCFECHGDFPHSKEPMIRSFLNMHTQFLGCMTCHTDPKKIDNSIIKFAWLNYSGIDVEGKPFGIDIDPNTGMLSSTDDYYSKIVIYKNSITTENLVEIVEDRVDVQEFIAVKDTLSDADREAIRKRFHLEVKGKGQYCPVCHTREDKAFLPYRELGFSERRIGDLTNLNIIGLVQKYEKFYLPKLFQSSADASSAGQEKNNK